MRVEWKHRNDNDLMLKIVFLCLFGFSLIIGLVLTNNAVRQSESSDMYLFQLKKGRRPMLNRGMKKMSAAMVLLAGSGIPAAAAEGELICGLPEHEHTDACFERTLICGLEESAPVYAEERHFVSDFQVIQPERRLVPHFSAQGAPL